MDTWDWYAFGAVEWLKKNPVNPGNILTFSYPSELEMLEKFKAAGLVLTRQGWERYEKLTKDKGER